MNKTIKNTSVIFLKMRIGIKSSSKYYFHPYSDIVKIITDINYVIIFLSGKVYYVDTRLKVFDKLLPSAFFRCNRSCIINMAYVTSIHYENKKVKIILTDEEEYNVSRNQKNIFLVKLEMLKNIALPCEKCQFCLKREKCIDFEPFITQKGTI